MELSCLDNFSIFEFYARYRDIVSRNDHATSRAMLDMLLKSFESRGRTRDTIFNDLSKLMSCLDLSVDSRQFNCFYDFVFFICRKEGQKNITVIRAIAAWRLVLAGRFRLLNQWCNFIEEHQRHNISEDAWQQLLAFSRCVNEDLEGYDPQGAWPVIIDDFVEYMYRIRNCNNCSSRDCNCGKTELPGITTIFSGLNLLPGSKRKSVSDSCWLEEVTSQPAIEPNNVVRTPKRSKHDSQIVFEYWDSGSDMSMSDLRAYLPSPNSACAVEDNLSKGFEGRLSIGC